MPCFDAPQIVAKQSFLAQSAAIVNASLFTPSSDGVFRVSVYAEVNSASSGDSVTVELEWDDDYATKLVTVGTAQGGVVAAAQGVIVLRGTSGNPILLEGVINSLTPPATYDVYVVVEQLW